MIRNEDMEERNIFSGNNQIQVDPTEINGVRVVANLSSLHHISQPESSHLKFEVKWGWLGNLLRILFQD